ncbi:hypothetical protein HID58_064605 [Brassica napus]|uniref:RAB6-interacting golgin n=1 Tax=Brassica napus TaxID=3708 RepID=A0ABQ7ZAG3_BRANA|nr:hypothetical protein HID58_064605 [Brassica napus]
MERITKWDLGSFRTYYSVEPSEKFHEHEYLDGSLVPRLETELWKAQSRIKELETEKFGSTENIRSFIRDQRIIREENTDPLLGSNSSDTLKKKMWDMESSVSRLRRERDTLEKVCEELVTRIDDLNAETRRKWDETEEEMQMLQMAELWREESVRVKLMDSKLSWKKKCLLMARKVGPEEMKLKRVEGLIKMARSLEDAANNFEFVSLKDN